LREVRRHSRAETAERLRRAQVPPNGERPPLSDTLDLLRQRVRKLEDDARKLTSKYESDLKAIEGDLHLARAAAAEVERQMGLKPGEIERSIRTVISNDEKGRAAQKRGPGRRASVEHPFILALGDERPTDWARRHKLDPDEVRSWYRPVDARKIPREIALLIERQLGVPLSAWRGVK
jgi:hypothetical protein